MARSWHIPEVLGSFLALLIPRIEEEDGLHGIKAGEEKKNNHYVANAQQIAPFFTRKTEAIA